MPIRDIERTRKRVGGLMTISPLWHLGHKWGSMPVVAVINSLVFLYSITSGGHTFKCLRIDFKLRALNRGARNPICLILINCFGSICSANSFRNLTPHMVLHFTWFYLLSVYLNVTWVLVIFKILWLLIQTLCVYRPRYSNTWSGPPKTF